jgi:hypothetical protein
MGLKKLRSLRELQHRGFLETYLGIPGSTLSERRAWGLARSSRAAGTRGAGTAAQGAGSDVVAPGATSAIVSPWGKS